MNADDVRAVVREVLQEQRARVTLFGWTYDDDMDGPAITINVRADMIVWWRGSRAWIADNGNSICEVSVQTLGSPHPITVRMLEADWPYTKKQLEGG